MPTYQYAGTECDHRFELVQSFTDAAASECPTCGGPVRKVFSSVGVVFKGSGFYRNDSRDAAKSASTAASASASASAAKSDSGSKSESKADSSSKSDSSSSTPKSDSSSSSSSSSASKSDSKPAASSVAS